MTGTETETTFTLPTVESSKIWSGDSADFAAVTQFVQTVASNVNVNISVFSNFPNLQRVAFVQNKIVGNIINFDVKLILFFTVSGQNTINGNLELFSFKQLQSFFLLGLNTVTGNINNFNIPTTLRLLEIIGNNTISGNISTFNAKNLTWFSIQGLNNISGDLGLFNFLKITIFKITGNNTINAYSENINNAFPLNMNEFTLLGTGQMPRTAIDRLLTKLAETTWTGSRIVRIQGNHASPTPGLPAIATLQSKGVTILVNP